MPYSTDVLRMQRNFNRMVDNLFDGAGWDDERSASVWNPAVDVEEREQEFVVRVELPGVQKEDVHIATQGNILTLRGEKKQHSESKESNYHRTERSYGSFQRSFTLPGSVKNDRIEASFSDGILEVVVPKAEDAKARTIDVKVR
jgi:HSP20 family protein